MKKVLSLFLSVLMLTGVVAAVIEQIHLYNKEKGMAQYDSVRGIFIEGETVYEGSAFMEKTHVQLCICNPNCIKGYFSPLSLLSPQSLLGFVGAPRSQRFRIAIILTF